MLTIVVTALVCAIISDLIQDPVSNAIVKMISGMILTITILAPIGSLDFSSFYDFDISIADAASAAADEGFALSREALYSRIKLETESYIQEKAETMNIDICAEISLSNEDLPVPVSAVISGSVSPFEKQQLQELMETDLRITKENLVWIG